MLPFVLRYRLKWLPWLEMLKGLMLLEMFTFVWFSVEHNVHTIGTTLCGMKQSSRSQLLWDQCHWWGKGCVCIEDQGWNKSSQLHQIHQQQMWAAQLCIECISRCLSTRMALSNNQSLLVQCTINVEGTQCHTHNAKMSEALLMISSYEVLAVCNLAFSCCTYWRSADWLCGSNRY